MKRGYVAPEVVSFGSINDVTRFTVKSSNQDFAWGPNGEVISNADDLGSVSYCRQADASLVPCDGPQD